MNTVSIGKYSRGFALSYILTGLLNLLLVIFKSTRSIHDWMASLTGHHWITHGILILVSFIAFGLIFSKIEMLKKFSEDDIPIYMTLSTIFVCLFMMLFFLVG
jgi:hypothetical protein